MDRHSILPILYDIAVTIGEQTSLQPLLTRALQRLLYYTSYPVGFICLDIAGAEQDEIHVRLDAAVGDFDLINAIGQVLPLPRALLHSADADDAQQLAILKTLRPVPGRYRSFLRLPLDQHGAVFLLAPVAPETRLPLTQMFKPVLAHLARAITLCRRSDAYTAGLKEERQLYATVFESSSSGVMIAHRDRHIMAVNQAFTRITGYSADEVLGRDPHMLSSGQHEPAFYSDLWRTVNEQGYWQGEIWNRRKNGESYPEWLSISAVRDAHGLVTHYVGIFSDISAEKKTEDLLHQMAFYDSLTQLPNRRLLMDRLLLACSSSARTGQFGAVLFMDLDDFKDINDAKGHDTGDLLLQEVAQRLLGGVREGDTVARLGGDEFVVILNALGTQATEAATRAEQVAEKIRDMLGQPFTLNTYTVYTSPSIGVALFRDQAHDVDTLLKQADISMYRAKMAGGNSIQFFDPRMQQEIDVRTELIDALREAVRLEQLHLHFQPQVDQHRNILGAEALMRWKHPKLGDISPAQFIPLAEDSSLITLIGLWSLWWTCMQLCAWERHAATRDLTLSLNVSPRQFRQPDFVQQVQDALRGSGANPQRLKLELTEGVMVDNPEDAALKMRALQQMGVSFSLDDFGIGYSSLQYLKQLPIDQIKIDQSFIRDITTDPNDAVIVKTIIAMAHALGLQVVAEGVETQAQRDYLESNGCLHYQGYLYGRPMPLDQFEAALRAHAAV